MQGKNDVPKEVRVGTQEELVNFPWYSEEEKKTEKNKQAMTQ